MDDEEGGGKAHFNFKAIVGEETTSSKRKRKKVLKKKKGEVKGEVKEEGEGFSVDVEDSRFSALFHSHHYNIDPSEPQFKKTQGMEALLHEKLKRRAQPTTTTPTPPSQSSHPTIPEKRRKEAELSFLVNSVKNKTKNAKLKLNKR